MWVSTKQNTPTPILLSPHKSHTNTCYITYIYEYIYIHIHICMNTSSNIRNYNRRCWRTTITMRIYSHMEYWLTCLATRNVSKVFTFLSIDPSSKCSLYRFHYLFPINIELHITFILHTKNVRSDYEIYQKLCALLYCLCVNCSKRRLQFGEWFQMCELVLAISLLLSQFVYVRCWLKSVLWTDFILYYGFAVELVICYLDF